MAICSSVPALAGGGGCHAATTDAQGTTIHVRDFCFAPTVLHIKPGDTVTWINDDQVVHTVTGSSMSFGDYTDVAPGKQVSYKFVASGAYPYYCAFHPGMVGTLVVGDGSGPGAAGRSTIQPLVQSVTTAAPTRVAAAAKPTTVSAPNQPLMVLLVGLFALVVAGGTWLGRRSR